MHVQAVDTRLFFSLYMASKRGYSNSLFSAVCTLEETVKAPTILAHLFSFTVNPDEVGHGHVTHRSHF